MSYKILPYKTNVNRIGQLVNASYIFHTPENSYIINLTNQRNQSNKRIFYLHFDISRRMLSPFGFEPAQAVNEGVPFRVYKTVANAIEDFYNKFSSQIDVIKLNGNSTLYSALVNRYSTEENTECAKVIKC